MTTCREFFTFSWLLRGRGSDRFLRVFFDAFLTVNLWTWRKPKRSMTRLIFEVNDWPKVVFVKLLHNARWFQNKSQLYFRLLDIESACIYPPAWGGLSGSNSCSGLLFGCQFPRTAIPFIFPNMPLICGCKASLVLNRQWMIVEFQY